jgi:hypothetical protein
MFNPTKAKNLLLPVSQKFNTFNTFNTFDTFDFGTPTR